jgi:Coenzyme PQQ synthesis protein D (PqqD)
MSVKEIPWNALLSKRSDLSTQDLDEDIVMADIQAGQFYGLGDSAKRIWELLDEPKSPAEICTRLMEEYDVEPAVCEQDVREFLGQLSGAGLIQFGK